MHLNKDSREFIELFNLTKVEYVVVGAFAVAWHGYPRFTGDIDVLVRPSDTNAKNVLATLAAFGFGSLDISQSDLSRPNQVIQLGVQPNRIDIITSISGLDFEEVWTHRVPGFIGDLAVPFISRENLIKNKQSTGRAKDLGDVEQLRKQNSPKR